MFNMARTIQKNWQQHKNLVIKGGQVIAALTLLAGVATTYLQSRSTNSSLDTTNDWMKNAIKEQSQKIQTLQIQNASLQTEVSDLKWTIQTFAPTLLNAEINHSQVQNEFGHSDSQP